jgi:hypothetical protein
VVCPLKADDDAEWLRLRYALRPHHNPFELKQEMAGIRANPDKETAFVAECGDGDLCGLIEVSIHKTAKGCRTDKVGYLEVERCYYYRKGLTRDEEL